ncbi:helix-turn-helix domain-containing protein [Photorhabdus luminescens]|uniref:XRE family transcriptional regulator n=2 Tax=Photorhabdus luminescens TaxID=29488 RepID=A0A5C4RH13_PHOLU|nr:helix-turn-helix transcriptional regulator [Photorhabdus luminescens]TDB48990.1 transcriptional regulator [Photorhabdus luminescens subsp. mexicana]TNH43165.1 XRE family transcriptional regulator [Photorhabdus luminescens subsp. sonorensis]
MRLIGNYSPPTTEDLIKLKEELGFTGEQMADLAGVSGNNQWRKYTGGKMPRVVSPHILFYIATQLTLSEDDLNRILAKMREIGANVR